LTTFQRNPQASPAIGGPCRDYDPSFKLYGCELGASHQGPHRDHRGNEWNEHLPHEPNRCDAHAPWGSCYPDQRCTQDSGHRGQHRDRSGNEWAEPETPEAAPASPVDEDAAAKLDAVRAVLSAFDWENDNRQYALEEIERIVTAGAR